MEEKAFKEKPKVHFKFEDEKRLSSGKYKQQQQQQKRRANDINHVRRYSLHAGP